MKKIISAFVVAICVMGAFVSTPVNAAMYGPWVLYRQDAKPPIGNLQYYRCYYMRSAYDPFTNIKWIEYKELPHELNACPTNPR